VITGLGVEGYRLAIEYLGRHLAPRQSPAGHSPGIDVMG
jgi:hypothetical protein